MTISGGNVAPTLGAAVAPLAPQPVNTVISVSVPFTDAGFLDTHSVDFDWDAEGTSAASTGSAGSGVAGGSHTYADPGVYAVNVQVTDDDGGSASTLLRYVVVYDPEAGFVTGGGHFDSPAGAFPADNGLTGRAHFAFVSRYKKGANVPTGNTQFRFQAAGMDFSSTSYEWLVVAGAKAMYKGTGSINGVGDYLFMVSAIDGALPGGGGFDKIRIKIWDRASGMIVYDNLVGAADVAAPVTTVTGGSIIIHQ
jgi:hypothetical protein